MKKHINLEWLAGKSEAEQRQLLDDKQEAQTWYTYPRVNAQEAEALRNGKAYRLTSFDLERLSMAYGYFEGFGFDGDMHTDPFIIKMLVKGYITENPKRLQEIAENNKAIARMIRQYGPGHYTVGVGLINHRWILTDAGKQFASQFIRD